MAPHVELIGHYLLVKPRFTNPNKNKRQHRLTTQLNISSDSNTIDFTSTIFLPSIIIQEDIFVQAWHPTTAETGMLEKQPLTILTNRLAGVALKELQNTYPSANFELRLLSDFEEMSTELQKNRLYLALKRDICPQFIFLKK